MYILYIHLSIHPFYTANAQYVVVIVTNVKLSLKGSVLSLWSELGCLPGCSPCSSPPFPTNLPYPSVSSPLPPSIIISLSFFHLFLL